MNILIDTHIFIWLLKTPQKLSEEHTALLRAPNSFFLSAISIAEMMIKSSIGKLKVDYDPVEMAIKSGLTLLDYSAEDARAIQSLPMHHKDSFDRMLISQCLNQKLSIMTNDIKFELYDCHLV